MFLKNKCIGVLKDEIQMVASDLISDFCSMNVSFRLQQESGYNQFPNWTIYIFQSFLFS